MKALLSLKPFFDDDKLITSFNKDQIDVFYEVFCADYVDVEFMFEGKRVKILPVNSRVEEFKEYNETFIHIITRKTSKGRIYEANRANRIHWIKPILENSAHQLILFYKWKDDDGICKNHYWFFKKNFMVVLKPISNDVMIVTSFCVDKDEQSKFHERYTNFKDGTETC